MKLVVAELIDNIDEKQQATRHAHGKPGNVDEREEFVLPNVPEGHEKVVSKHSGSWLGKV
jgi:hypothetical protein